MSVTAHYNGLEGNDKLRPNKNGWQLCIMRVMNREKIIDEKNARKFWCYDWSFCLREGLVFCENGDQQLKGLQFRCAKEMPHSYSVTKSWLPVRNAGMGGEAVYARI